MCLGLAVTGVVTLVFSVVLGGWQALVAGAALFTLIIIFWWVIPRRLRALVPPAARP